MLDEQAVRLQAKRDSITHLSTGVAVCSGGKILVVRRVAADDTLAGEWELPGGGVDEGESITDGAIRELYEETGLVVGEVLGTFPGFDYTTPRKPKVRQFNFKVATEHLHVRLDPTEHDDYRWITEPEIDFLHTNSVMQQCLHDAFAQ